VPGFAGLVFCRGLIFRKTAAGLPRSGVLGDLGSKDFNAVGDDRAGGFRRFRPASGQAGFRIRPASDQAGFRIRPAFMILMILMSLHNLCIIYRFFADSGLLAMEPVSTNEPSFGSVFISFIYQY
jgi:hypothetical protein